MKEDETIQNFKKRLVGFCAMAAELHQEAIRLMKELEQLSVPLPSGGKKKGPLPQEEIDRILGNRLRQIDREDKKTVPSRKQQVEEMAVDLRKKWEANDLVAAIKKHGN